MGGIVGAGLMRMLGGGHHHGGGLFGAPTWAATSGSRATSESARKVHWTDAGEEKIRALSLRGGRRGAERAALARR